MKALHVTDFRATGATIDGRGVLRVNGKRKPARPIMRLVPFAITRADCDALEFVAPIHTVSEANSHAYWRDRHARAKAQRIAAEQWLRSAFGAAERGFTAAAIVVTITRIAPRELDDADNLPGSQKHVRDGLADVLSDGNDRDPRVTYRYAQERGAPRTYGVRVRIVPRRVCEGCGQVCG